MKDLKYLAALSIPLSAIFSIYFKVYWSYTTPVFAFLFLPALELLLPIDNKNLGESEIDSKLKNQLFDWLLYLNIPLVYGILVYALYTISNSSLHTYEYFGIVLSTGIVLGVNGINVGHELGHRQQTFEKYLGKILLLPSLYMHFYIEHNFGHHLHAATKEDPATARYNQTVYSFWITSITRQYFSAWKIQNRLLKASNKSFVSLKNDMLWFVVFQALFLLTIYVFFGVPGLVFSLLSAFVGVLLLETVNYIEHYGLLRSKKTSGRYERVKEIHSWNSNHVLGRIILYELTRHSDHHFKSSKKYQILDCYEDSPQMPFGYPTSMVLSLVPPLWFKIMNKRIPRQMISLA